jgi:hypothetical protein
MLVSRVIAVLIAVAVVLILLPFMHLQNAPFVILIWSGINLALLGAFWRNYYLRKLSAIKSAAKN